MKRLILALLIGAGLGGIGGAAATISILYLIGSAST